MTVLLFQWKITRKIVWFTFHRHSVNSVMVKRLILCPRGGFLQYLAWIIQEEVASIKSIFLLFVNFIEFTVYFASAMYWYCDPDFFLYSFFLPYLLYSEDYFLKPGMDIYKSCLIWLIFICLSSAQVHLCCEISFGKLLNFSLSQLMCWDFILVFLWSRQHHNRQGRWTG